MVRKNILKFLIVFMFGIFLIPNFSYGAILLQDDFTGTVIDQTKWTIIGTQGSTVIQNDNMNVRNSGNDGVVSLNSVSTFSRDNDLTVSANMTATGSFQYAYLGYGDSNRANGTAYYVQYGSTIGLYAIIMVNGDSSSIANYSCSTYTAGAKISLKMITNGFEVYKNDILQCSITGSSVTNKSIFLQGFLNNSFFDNLLVTDNISFSAPSAIANLAASEWGNTTTNLTWTAPSNGGDPITDYIVDYRVSGDVPWTNFVDGVSASTGATVTGLTNGVTYEFRVRAVNGIGTAPDSNIASVTVSAPTVPSTPSAPTASLVFNVIGQVASVAFTPPSANGSAITSYTVTSSPGGFTGTGATSPIVISGLTNGQAYTFTVTATNGVGVSSSSPSSNSVTPIAFPDGNARWTQQTASGQRDWRDIASSSDGMKLAAVVNDGYVYTSLDGGVSWNQKTTSGVRFWRSVDISDDGSKIIASVFNGYVYTSSNGGDTWTTHSSIGQRNWNSVAMSADGSYMYAAPNNGNASNNSFFRSIDGGNSWSFGLSSVKDWEGIATSSNGQYVYLAPQLNAPSYIYYSSNYGANNDLRVDSGNRQWTSIAASADGVKVLASVSNGYIYTSANYANNFTERSASGTRLWNAVAASGDFEVLVASSITSVVTSIDGGVSWQEEVNSANWKSVASSADGTKVFAVTDGGYIYTGIIDLTPPVISEITPVTTPTNDNTPSYTFSSDEAGNITYGGSCTSATDTASVGNNTITFNVLADNTYANCTITVTDESGNVSNLLAVNTFVVDATGPTVAEITPVTTPTNDNTPSYTFSSDEAGNITYGGSCTSATGTATVGNNTITLAILADGEYSDCTITVTDAAGNVSNLLEVNTFVVDATSPVIAEVTPVATPSTNTTPSYTFSSDEAGDITYGGSCTSATNTATVGNNTITFDVLPVGDYADCTIVVTDDLNNNSNQLNITPFTITAPVVVQNEVAPAGSVSVVFLQELSDRLRAGSAIIDTGCAPGNLYSVTTGNRCTSNTNTVNPVNSTCPVLPSAPRLLRFNMTNPAVKILQQILNCKGYIISDFGAGSPGKETNFFGLKTREIVIKFQKDNDLTPDGIVGPIFRRSLDN